MLSLSPLLVSILPILGVCIGEHISKPRHYRHHHRHIETPLVENLAEKVETNATEVKTNATKVETHATKANSNATKVNPVQPGVIKPWTQHKNVIKEEPPVDFQKWWVINNTNLRHAESQLRYNPTTSNFEDLQGDWLDRLGKGTPTFITREIDFEKSSQPFFYMFPGGPDVDNYHQDVFEKGIFEPFISYHLSQDIKRCCAEERGHVLDVGGNFGWYSLLSASLGCKVDTFEPVPWYRSLLNYNKAALNMKTLSNRITVHNNTFLGSSVGQKSTIVVPTLAHGENNKVYVNTEQSCNQGPACFEVETTTVDSAMGTGLDELQSCAVRIDAEGFEPDVIAGAQDYLTNKQPRVIILSLAPGMQGRYNRQNEKNTAMFDVLVYRGYIPHLLTLDVIKNKNLNVDQGTLNAKRWKERPTTELITKCGFSCVIYFQRPF